MLSFELTTGKALRQRAFAGKIRDFFLFAWLTGCSASHVGVPPNAAHPTIAVPPPPVDASLDHDWGERDLRRVPAVLTLPDARAWHASASGSFTLLEHRPTHSTLALRVSLAPRLVKPEECEADARLARPTLPTIDPSSVVERRALAAPAGFDVRLVVGVVPSPQGVHGYALAIGAATNRCYVAAFETESRGVDAADRVAERLAVVVAGVFETLRIQNADAEVPPPLRVK